MDFLLVSLALILSLVLAALVVLLGRMILFMVPMLHGPVFVPSADDKLKSMLKLAQLKKGDKVIDLGSGDGKVVIAVAQQGCTVEGVEINPLLIRKSRKLIEELGLSDKATISNKNFWDIDFSKYDVIFSYGTSYIMERLEKKVIKELRPGARFVSNYFQFPHLKPKVEENDVRLYQSKI